MIDSLGVSIEVCNVAIPPKIENVSEQDAGFILSWRTKKMCHHPGPFVEDQSMGCAPFEIKKALTFENGFVPKNFLQEPPIGDGCDVAIRQ